MRFRVSDRAQQRQDRGVCVLVGRPLQRGPLLSVPSPRIGARGEERAHDLDIAGGRGEVQRRAVDPVASVAVGPGGQQRFDDGGRTPEDRMMERSAVLPFQDDPADPRPPRTLHGQQRAPARSLGLAGVRQRGFCPETRSGGDQRTDHGRVGVPARGGEQGRPTVLVGGVDLRAGSKQRLDHGHLFVVASRVVERRGAVVGFGPDLRPGREERFEDRRFPIVASRVVERRGPPVAPGVDLRSVANEETDHRRIPRAGRGVVERCVVEVVARVRVRSCPEQRFDLGGVAPPVGGAVEGGLAVEKHLFLLREESPPRRLGQRPALPRGAVVVAAAAPGRPGNRAVTRRRRFAARPAGRRAPSGRRREEFAIDGAASNLLPLGGVVKRRLAPAVHDLRVSPGGEQEFEYGRLLFSLSRPRRFGCDIGGQMQGSALVRVNGAWIGPRPDQRPDAFLPPAPRGEVERGSVLPVPIGDRGSRGEEDGQRGRGLAARRQVQRRAPLPVRGVHTSAAGQQARHDRLVRIVPRRQVQRCPSVLVLRVEVGAARDQGFDFAEDAVRGRQMERSADAPIRVAGTASGGEKRREQRRRTPVRSRVHRSSSTPIPGSEVRTRIQQCDSGSGIPLSGSQMQRRLPEADYVEDDAGAANTRRAEIRAAVCQGPEHFSAPVAPRRDMNGRLPPAVLLDLHAGAQQRLEHLTASPAPDCVVQRVPSPVRYAGMGIRSGGDQGLDDRNPPVAVCGHLDGCLSVLGRGVEIGAGGEQEFDHRRAVSFGGVVEGDSSQSVAGMDIRSGGEQRFRFRGIAAAGDPVQGRVPVLEPAFHHGARSRRGFPIGRMSGGLHRAYSPDLACAPAPGAPLRIGVAGRSISVSGAGVGVKPMTGVFFSSDFPRDSPASSREIQEGSSRVPKTSARSRTLAKSAGVRPFRTSASGGVSASKKRR